jgi:hypothetical protein
MKRFIFFLIIVGVIGYVGWSYQWMGFFGIESETSDEQSDQAEGGDQAAATAPDEEVVDPDRLQLDPSLVWGAEALATEQWDLYAKAQKAWVEIVEGGKDPVAVDKAPTIALAFSQVLKATYNQPELKAFQKRLVAERLVPLGEALFFTPRKYDDDIGLFSTHVVVSGDILTNVSKDYGMSYQFANIMRGRDDVEDSKLSIGDRLKMVNAKEKGSFIHIDKGDFFLDLYISDVFAKRYPIGHGADETPTPTGTARIDKRGWHPNWTDPEGRVLAYGHPENILGPVWLRLKTDEIGQSGIGIHGFNGDLEMATNVRASHGCVRMRNEDAIELYNILAPVSYLKSDGSLLQRAPMWVRIVE